MGLYKEAVKKFLLGGVSIRGPNLGSEVLQSQKLISGLINYQHLIILPSSVLEVRGLSSSILVKAQLNSDLIAGGKEEEPKIIF